MSAYAIEMKQILHVSAEVVLWGVNTGRKDYTDGSIKDLRKVNDETEDFKTYLL